MSLSRSCRIASGLRCLSSPSSSSSKSSSRNLHHPITTSHEPSPINTHDAVSSTTSLPPWLNRILHLWDQESGTHEILDLKEKVNASSLAFDTLSSKVSRARTTLDRALQAFEDSQLQHNRLLQGRERWTPAQALEFAKLLEKEVQIRQELEAAKKELLKLETRQVSSMNQYMNDLRRRYQEEQLWQDKWRIYSTFTTWGLIVLNTVVFLVAQYMHRVREAIRVEEFRRLLEASLMANEGTLKVVQEKNREDSQLQKQHQQTTVSEETTPESEQETTPQSDTSSNEKTPKVDETNSKPNMSSKLQLKSKETPIHRYRGLQYVQGISKRLYCEYKKVDIPSAILGASVTGASWLVVTLLSSSPKGK